MAHSAEHKLVIENSFYELTKSEYDKVIFHEIAHSYSIDADVECRYSLAPMIILTEGDRIGLFKIGWKDIRECITYLWVHPPDEKEGGGELVTLFKAQDLPKDDGQFYQFCYITDEGYVRGASISFRFRRPIDDELVEIPGDNDDSDLLIIRSESSVLEERLRDVTLKNIALVKENCDLELRLCAKSKMCTNLEVKLKKLEFEAMEEKKNMTYFSQEKDELMLQMRVVLSTSTEQNDKMKNTLSQNDKQISELEDKIKALTQQKDELTLKWTMEIEKTNHLKKQLKESEIRQKAFQVKNEKLSNELVLQRENVNKLNQQIKSLKVSLSEEQKKNGKLEDKLSVVELDTKQALAQLADAENILIAIVKSKQLALNK